MNRLFTTLALCFATISMSAADRLITSKAPTGIELKHDFEVKARTNGGEWQSIDTYAFKVDRVANAKHNVELTSVAKFEFDGKVEVQVKSLAQDIKSFKIRPNSYGIKAVQDGNTLTFKLDRPRYISVEINGNIYQNLQLFADNIIEKPKVKNILVLRNAFEKTRKQMKANALSINALSDNLNFPMFAELTLKKT